MLLVVVVGYLGQKVTSKHKHNHLDYNQTRKAPLWGFSFIEHLVILVTLPLRASALEAYHRTLL
jgi:hypothetical protein